MHVRLPAIHRLAIATAVAVLATPAGAQAKEGDVPPARPPFQWVNVGPTSIAPTGVSYDMAASSGRVSSIAVTSNSIFVATANGGVWRRDTASGTWYDMTDGLRDLAFGAVAVAPSDQNVIYAGTGEDHGGCVDCAPGEDLYKSSDGGSTWTTLTPLRSALPAVGMQTSSIAVNSTNPNVVWVGGTLGVFRSQDGGSTWTTIAAADPNFETPIVDLKLDDTQSDVAYFTDRRHVMRVSGSGTPTLTDITVPAVATYEAQNPSAIFAITVAVAPSAASTIYAAYAYAGNVNTGCMAGLYKSTDSGATWTNISVSVANDYFSSAYAYGGNSTGCQGWYDNALAVDPTNANHLVGAGVALADFDTTTPSAPVQRNLSTLSFAHPDHHALAFDSAGDLYDGSDGGVWYFSHADLAAGTPGTGQNVGTGLAATQFSAGVSVRSDGAILAGSQDNGSELYSSGANGWAWKRVAMGDGGYTAIDPRTQTIFYHEFFSGNMEASTNSGASWANVAPSFGGQAVAWMMPYRMDANNSLAMIAGASQPFATNTGGVSVGGAAGWIGIAPTGLTKINAIDWTPGHTQIVVGDSDGNVAYSLDGATTWNATSVTGTVTVVKIDPYASGTIWVGSRDADNPFVPHLTRLTVAPGVPATKSTVEAGLTSPVESLALLPGVLVAGTDRGVTVRNRYGGTWTPLAVSPVAPEIPAVPVVDLAVRNFNQTTTTGSLVALTHGRGAWISNDLTYLGQRAYVPLGGRYATISIYPFAGSSLLGTIAKATGGFNDLKQLAFDPAGDLFATSWTPDAIFEYAPGATSGATPIRTISGDATQLGTYSSPIAADANQIYVGKRDYGKESILVFSATANGNAAPTAVIAGSNTGLKIPEAVAVAAGKLYVTSCDCNNGPSFPSSVLVFPVSASGNVAPERTIAGPHTGLDNPNAVAVDASGKIYVGNRTSITEYAPGASGDATPVATISGALTGVSVPTSLMVDADGDVMAGNQYSLTVYAPGANGNVAPVAAMSARGGTVVR